MTTENDSVNNIQSTDEKAGLAEKAVEQTKKWVEKIVIKHNFCPFAAKPFKQNTIRYVALHGAIESDLVDDIVNELSKLRDAKPEKIETSILVLTSCLTAFEDYNQFLDVIDAILEEMDLVGEIQVATFHPDYCFADLAPDDVRNYTNRSIYPMFHLIRENSVEAARETYPDVDQVPEKNMQLLEEMGIDAIKEEVTNIKK